MYEAGVGWAKPNQQENKATGQATSQEEAGTTKMKNRPVMIGVKFTQAAQAGNI